MSKRTYSRLFLSRSNFSKGDNAGVSGIISKVVASAVANSGLEPEEAVVTSCRVDRGPVLKRFTPRARGSASPKHRPMAHIYVEVAAIEGDK